MASIKFEKGFFTTTDKSLIKALSSISQPHELQKLSVMIQINKNKKGLFFVSYAAKNGEILATSESFTAKQSTWKNIIAMYSSGVYPQAPEPWFVEVTDMTGKKPQLYLFNLISKTKQKR